MGESSARDIFLRTLPLFDDQDRDIIQRLLHHAVEDLEYDHPDRKIARDLYHEIREGEGIRLLVGPGLDKETLVIAPREVDSDVDEIIERFIGIMNAESGEWPGVATELGDWHERADGVTDIKVAFQYLH